MTHIYSFYPSNPLSASLQLPSSKMSSERNQSAMASTRLAKAALCVRILSDSGILQDASYVARRPVGAPTISAIASPVFSESPRTASNVTIYAQATGGPPVCGPAGADRQSNTCISEALNSRRARRTARRHMAQTGNLYQPLLHRAGTGPTGKLKYKQLPVHTMSDVSDGWPVWIPLIVGLAPGLVYWLAITARRSK